MSIPFQGLSSFLEEGRYPDLSTFPNLEGKEEMKPGSVKFMPEDLGSPEISLYSSSSFAGRMTDSWATHADFIPTKKGHIYVPKNAKMRSHSDAAWGASPRLPKGPSAMQSPCFITLDNESAKKAQVREYSRVGPQNATAIKEQTPFLACLRRIRDIGRKDMTVQCGKG